MAILRRRWLSSVVGVAALAVMLFPLYWMLNASLQPNGATVATSWFPVAPDLSGYRTALGEQGTNLLTSLVVSLGTVVFSLVIAVPAAYALTRLRIRWATPVLFAILISQMIPGIVIANSLYDVYTSLGLLNSIPGLIVADASAGIPFAILIVRAHLARFPVAIIEAGLVDGAGPIRVFWTIVLPVIRNALITAGLFVFLFAWGDFLFALTLTSTEDVRPVTLGIYHYIGSYVTDWSSVMATAVLASLPALVLLIIAQKYVAAGATGGAIK
jgi:multiple sugar transport system permease protein